MQKEEEQRKLAEQEAAKVQMKAKEDRRNVVQQIETIFSICDGVNGATIQEDIKSDQLSKTAAKSDFFLHDSNLKDVDGEKVGRAIKYNAVDVIKAAEKSHRFPSLLSKIQDRKTPSRVSLYGGYLMKKLHDEMAELDQAVVDGAMEEAEAKLKQKVSESEAKLKAAQQDVKTQQEKVRAFQNAFGENGNATPKKKRARTTADDA